MLLWSRRGWRKRLMMGRIYPRIMRHSKVLCAGSTMRCALLFAVMLIAGCSTQYYKSEYSSEVVARCIEKEWHRSMTHGVLIERQPNGIYFVAVTPRLPASAFPSGLKHPLYTCWVEVNDTNSGSVTTYHRPFPNFHAWRDKAVQNCQEPNDCNMPNPEP